MEGNDYGLSYPRNCLEEMEITVKYLSDFQTRDVMNMRPYANHIGPLFIRKSFSSHLMHTQYVCTHARTHARARTHRVFSVMTPIF